MTVVSSPDTAVSAAGFTRAFREHAGGVAVITADPGDGPVGITATSVASVSADPPVLMFSLSHASSSAPSILASETAVVHLLDADQLGLATLCATSGVDRFADTSTWSRLETGEPHFHTASRWVRGRLATTTPAGSATVVTLEALEVQIRDDDGRSAHREGEGPLVYHDRRWHVLGEHSRLPG